MGVDVRPQISFPVWVDPDGEYTLVATVFEDVQMRYVIRHGYTDVSPSLTREAMVQIWRGELATHGEDYIMDSLRAGLTVDCWVADQRLAAAGIDGRVCLTPKLCYDLEATAQNYRENLARC